MSKEHNFCWSAHPNIYNSFSQREFSVYFSEPDQGIKEDTGILLLIPGFGGNAQSKVYKQMRNRLSDQYNLIVVQCDYFGQEFMQNSIQADINMSKDSLLEIFTESEFSEIFGSGFNNSKFFEISKNKKVTMLYKESLKESIDNFNDMGVMQALDHLTALFYIFGILKDNNYSFNTKKIIIYGHSHGAFIGYMCNAFISNLFTLMIDNSAWLFPMYLRSPRYLTYEYGGMKAEIEFDYLASKMNLDEEIYNLSYLYQNSVNNCNIQIFHGESDVLVDCKAKMDFCSSIPNCTMNLISKNDLDGSMFKSTNHGLDADFFELFKHVLDKVQFDLGSNFNFSPNTIKTAKNSYRISLDSGGVPILKNKFPIFSGT